MRRLAVLVVVLSSPAHGQDESEPVEEPAEAAAPARPGTGFVGAGAGRLVDARGHVFALEGEVWRNLTRGSLAPTLATAVERDGVLWAAGGEPPAFRFTDGTWQASPVRREGAAQLSRCAGLGVSAGRRIFRRSAAAWQELPILPRGVQILQLCVTPTEVSLLAADGRWLVRAGGWKPVRLPPDTRLSWLGGADRPLAASEDGRLFVLHNGKAVRVAVDAHPLAVSPRGKLLLARSTGTVLAELRGHELLVRGPGPAVVDVLALLDDGSVVARDGTLHRLIAGAWTALPFTAAPVAPSAGRPNPPARSGP